MEAPRLEGNDTSTDPVHTQLASISAPAGQEEGSEVTLLGSDSDDEFFPPDADVNGVKVDEAVRSQEDALSKEQLLLRRLDHIKELQDLYKAELWGTLEEMHARHHHFQSPDAAEATSGSAEFQPLQTVLGKRRAAEASAGKAGDQTADAGTSEDDVDVVMIEASPGDQPTVPDALPNDVEAAQDGSAAASAVAASEQGTQQAAGHADAVEDPPTFSEAEEFVLTSSTAAADAQQLARLRQQTRARLGRIARLEQAASASTARQLDRSGALAMLSGQHVRFLIKRSAFTIGRPTSTHGTVDVDLGKEGNASQVSRQQARFALRLDGAFTITNCGRRKLHVNGCQVERGQSAVMQHLSLLEVGGIRLLLYINHSAVRRLLARSASFGDFPGG
ncbi:probable microspherule protein 1 at C-terminar half [Coccomyxa sp. Obi]|nr:probable microspherule protein 1 at C-terminar half [Coccomyxa sp. Obi]